MIWKDTVWKSNTWKTSIWGALSNVTKKASRILVKLPQYLRPRAGTFRK